MWAKAKYKVVEFKYLGTTVTSQNYILAEIGSRLYSGTTCCHSGQGVWSSRLLFKNIRIQIYKIIILPVVLWV
jgi:hypothetical protein